MVWTVPSPLAEAVRCCPSSLYTFTGIFRSLARDWHAECFSEAFPEFEQIDCTVSEYNPQLCQESCALSELSYVDNSCFRSGVVPDAPQKINQPVSVMLPADQAPLDLAS